MIQVESQFDTGSVAPFAFLRGDSKFAAGVVSDWLGKNLLVRRVRGRKMRTLNGLFDEMSAALQFPYYFGENWAAFDECISEIDLQPSCEGIVIAVLGAGEVLVDAPTADLRSLVRAFTHAAQTYAAPIDSGEWWDRPAVPFRVVLQAGASEGMLTYERWAGSGAEFTTL